MLDELSGKHKIVAIKKLLIFFFAFPGLSGKFGKQSLRFRAAKTFFFGITAFFAAILSCLVKFGTELKIKFDERKV